MISSKGISQRLRAAILKAQIAINRTKKLSPESKGATGNIVTRADVASERVICETLREYFPGCSILTEETASDITSENYHAAPLLFVVDPIDGTTNFRNGLYGSAISIGVFGHGMCLQGIIFDLTLKDQYEILRGGGVWKNDEKLIRKPTRPLRETVVISDWAYGDTPLELIPKWQRLAGKAASVRVIGSAIIDMVFTATGQGGAFFHNSLKPWDGGAALLMLEEMGLRVTNWSGEPSTIFDETIVAAPPELYDEFYTLLFK